MRLVNPTSGNFAGGNSMSVSHGSSAYAPGVFAECPVVTANSRRRSNARRWAQAESTTSDQSGSVGSTPSLLNCITLC